MALKAFKVTCTSDTFKKGVLPFPAISLANTKDEAEELAIGFAEDAVQFSTANTETYFHAKQMKVSKKLLNILIKLAEEGEAYKGIHVFK